MKKEKFQFLHWNFSVLSYLDSNQDKLIQSQMCYRYTIGQSVFFFRKRVQKYNLFWNWQNFFELKNKK